MSTRSLVPLCFPHALILAGQLVYFLGFGKGTDGTIKVFNPLLSEYKYYKKTTMEEIAKCVPFLRVP